MGSSNQQRKTTVNDWCVAVKRAFVLSGSGEEDHGPHVKNQGRSHDEPLETTNYSVRMIWYSTLPPSASLFWTPTPLVGR
jgi:hypothetical protein